MSNHGPGWARLMRLCGLEPTVYSRVDGSGLTRKFIYACPNGCHDFKLSTRKHNSILRGRGRICNTCRSPISWTGRTEEPRL
jgi:predicted SprT family Zn-dependent metalloprotease